MPTTPASNPLRLLHQTADETGVSGQFGPYHIESLIAPADEGMMTAYRVRIEPGRVTAVSYHKLAEELYYVLEGTGTALLDGAPSMLRPGDFLRLPPGTTHGFITGEEELVLLNIHAPGSRPDHDVYFTGEVPPGFGGNADVSPEVSRD